MCLSIVYVSIHETINGTNEMKTIFVFFKNALHFYTRYIISNLFLNSYNICVQKAACMLIVKHMLCHFLERTATSLYSGHSACNLGQLVLTLNLLSCDLRLQFLITPKVFVSLCGKNQLVCLCKSPVICTCSFKERPRVSFDSCCLVLIFMRLIFTSIGCVSVGLSINTFYPHRTNSMGIKCSYMSAKCCHK